MADPRSFGPDGRPRGRGLSLPFAGEPGPLNAITDVEGVGVGFTTLIDGEGALHVGRGPVRTGVTAIRPRLGDGTDGPVWAGAWDLNGNGELTGSHWIAEAGYFAGPVVITNTHAVGTAHTAVIRWLTGRRGDRLGDYNFALPVVGETSDATLNDMNGFHVTEAHVLAALEGAASGPVPEGSVGGGTGMTAYEFKAGTGTASRRVRVLGNVYTVGVLVQANHGLRPWLSVLGVPVGEAMPEGRYKAREEGSIIAVAATDAPLHPLQMRRLARRIGLGVGRTGTPGGDTSGDLFLAFSTANPIPPDGARGMQRIDFLPNPLLDRLFLAVVEATEEAIVNALVAARTMEGCDGRRVLAIDHDRLRAVMARHGRLANP